MQDPTAFARRALVVALFAFMLWSPVYRQVLGGESDWFRQWSMYGSRADHVCEVRYEQRAAEGWVPLSRWDALGFALDPFPRRRDRLLGTPEEAADAGRELCPHVDRELRFRLRCGDRRRGWDEWIVVEGLCR